MGSQSRTRLSNWTELMVVDVYRSGNKILHQHINTLFINLARCSDFHSHQIWRDGRTFQKSRIPRLLILPEFASWGISCTTEYREDRVTKTVQLYNNSESIFQNLKKYQCINISAEQILNILMGLGQTEKELRTEISQLIGWHVFFF